MFKKMAMVACSAALFSVIVVPAVAQPVEDSWDSRTIMTFNQPVELSGIVLPAGSYVFKLLDSDWNRRILQVFNADETRLLTTTIALSTERHSGEDFPVEDPATHKTVMTFEERAANSPQAIRTWFYPDRQVGLEFVYPNIKAKPAIAKKTSPKPVSIASVTR
jgi:hypothetical protein